MHTNLPRMKEVSPSKVRFLFLLSVLAAALALRGLASLSSSFGANNPTRSKEVSLKALTRKGGGGSSGSSGSSRLALNDEPVVSVLLTMFGTDPGFFDETEVFLKSLLLNAPRSSAATMNIYVVTNHEAFEAIGPVIFHRMGIPYRLYHNQSNTDSKNSNNSNLYPSAFEIINTSHTLSLRSESALTWWLPVNFIIIDVDKYSHTWMEEVGRLRLNNNATASMSINQVHTVGSFYRLFAYRVLPVDLDSFIYSDTDVVMLADVSALWDLAVRSPPEVLFHWCTPGNSGFMLVKNNAELWDLIAKVDLAGLNQGHFYDQDLYVLVNETHPNRVRWLPDEWNYAFAWGFRNTKNLRDFRPQLGTGHFNGNGGAAGAWWQHVEWLRNYKELDPFYSSFFYYVDMPWSQAQYLALSKLRYTNHAGFPVRAMYIEDPETWNLSRAYNSSLSSLQV